MRPQAVIAVDHVSMTFSGATPRRACTRSTTSRLKSARASSSACSAHRAAARARCSASSAACSQPTAGAVTVAGATVDRPRPHDIAFVFQESTLLPWYTVLENFRLALKFQGTGECALARARDACALRRRHGAVRQPLSQAALRRHEAAHQPRARAVRRDRRCCCSTSRSPRSTSRPAWCWARTCRYCWRAPARPSCS